MNLVARRKEEACHAIESACKSIGRDASEVSIMAVTKTHSLETAQLAIDAGISLLGENRLQEAQQKFTRPERSFSLTLIGHLQKNKAKKAALFFDAIHSVDSLECAQMLAKSCEETNKTLEILLEYKSSQDQNKTGFDSEDSLKRELDSILELKNLKVAGLMTIGPLGNDDYLNRQAFSKTRVLFESIKSSHKLAEWQTLSMGMSGDFVSAVEEGSTLVRLGTYLFGSRP